MKLIVITDWSVPDCLERAKAAASVDSRVAIQHRHHGVSRAQFVDEAKRLREVCSSLFINSDVDLANELGAGLHLPEHLHDTGFSGPLSIAVHCSSPLTPTRSPLSQGEGVSAVIHLVSPVYAPNSKAADRPPLGPAGFHALAATLPGPAFALGGITVERIAELKPLAGVAVIGAVMHALDAARATEALLRALE